MLTQTLLVQANNYRKQQYWLINNHHGTCNQSLNAGNQAVNSLTVNVNIRYKKAQMECP